MQFVGLRHGTYHKPLNVERIVCNMAGACAVFLTIAGALWCAPGALLLIPTIRSMTRAGRLNDLHREKFEAVVAQDYTHALKVRDEIRRLKGSRR